MAAYGKFRGTHTVEGDRCLRRDRRWEADYVYVIDFDGDRFHQMTKIWNDGISLKQLGWV